MVGMNTIIPTMVSAPQEGQLWYDTAANVIKVYSQGNWTTVVEDDYELLSKKEW